MLNLREILLIAEDSVDKVLVDDEFGDTLLQYIRHSITGFEESETQQLGNVLSQLRHLQNMLEIITNAYELRRASSLNNTDEQYVEILEILRK